MSIIDKYPQVDIAMEGHGRGKVSIDGKELVGVSGSDLRIQAGENNQLTVSLSVPRASYSGQVELEAEVSAWPDPVKRAVLEALQSEDSGDQVEPGSVRLICNCCDLPAEQCRESQ